MARRREKPLVRAKVARHNPIVRAKVVETKKTPYQLVLLVGGLLFSLLRVGQFRDLLDMDVLGWEGGHVLGLQLGLARPLSCVFVLDDGL